MEHLKRFEQLGFDEVTLRITSWDQRGQTGPPDRGSRAALRGGRGCVVPSTSDRKIHVTFPQCSPQRCSANGAHLQVSSRACAPPLPATQVRLPTHGPREPACLVVGALRCGRRTGCWWGTCAGRARRAGQVCQECQCWQAWVSGSVVWSQGRFPEPSSEVLTRERAFSPSWPRWRRIPWCRVGVGPPPGAEELATATGPRERHAHR